MNHHPYNNDTSQHFCPFTDSTSIFCKFEPGINKLHIYFKSDLANINKSEFRDSRDIFIVFACIDSIIFVTLKIGALPWYVIPVPPNIIHCLSGITIHKSRFKISLHLIDKISNKSVGTNKIYLPHEKACQLKFIVSKAELSTVNECEYKKIVAANQHPALIIEKAQVKASSSPLLHYPYHFNNYL